MFRNLYRKFTGSTGLDPQSEHIVRGFVDNFVKSNNLSLAAGAAIQIGWPEQVETDEMRQSCIDLFKAIGFSVTMDDYPQPYQIHIVEIARIRSRHPLMQDLRHLRQELYAEAKELTIAYVKQHTNGAHVIEIIFPNYLGRYDLTGNTPYSRRLRIVFDEVFYKHTSYRLWSLDDTYMRYYNGGNDE